MKKIDRIIPGKTGNMGGGGRAGIELAGQKILVRQFYEILFLKNNAATGSFNSNRINKKRQSLIGPALV
jgi:hypothetical protein